MNGEGGAGPSTVIHKEKTWDELVKAREEERERAIREGKMDDPSKPKRLEEAITYGRTCMDMCPELNATDVRGRIIWIGGRCTCATVPIVGQMGNLRRKSTITVPVKIYERGQGDKIIPSDLRPAPDTQVYDAEFYSCFAKGTLDYLFHDLIPRGGFAETQAFVRDRSRAVRNDFTIQQDTGAVAMECHERCTRFHILSLHLMYGNSGFDRALEIQQCMNSLLSLKEFYDDQRSVYQSPNELEMRIYHRLGLIRDQHERNDKPPPHIAADPAFQLITRFRSQVQEASRPITKVSKLLVSPEAMASFGELAGVLRERGNVVMVYLVACFLEHIFGKGTIEEDEMEKIVEGLSVQDIIDGRSDGVVGGGVLSGSASVGDTDGEGGMTEDVGDEDMAEGGVTTGTEEMDELDAFIEDAADDAAMEETQPEQEPEPEVMPSPLKRGATQWLTENFGAAPVPPSGVSASHSAPVGSTFGTQTQTPPAPSSSTPFLTVPKAGESVFGRLATSSSAPTPVFGTVFGGGQTKNVFGGPVFGAPKPQPVVEQFKPQASASGFFNTTMPTSPPSLPSTSTLTSTPGAGPSTQGQKRTFSSLADQPPLGSDGPPDTGRPASSFIVKPESPLQASKSMSSFNPSAPPFSPFGGMQSRFPTSASAGTVPSSQPQLQQKPTLAPLKTDSLTISSTETPPLLRKRTELALNLPSPSPSVLFPPPPAIPETPTATGPSLRVNTNVGLGLNVQSTGFIRKSTSIDSPIGPPPLSRPAPISLPGTPTATTQSPGFPPPQSPGVLFDAGAGPSLLFSNATATASPFRRFPGLAQGIQGVSAATSGPGGIAGIPVSRSEPSLASSSKIPTSDGSDASIIPTSRSDSFVPKKRLKFTAEETEEDLLEEAEERLREKLLSRCWKNWRERYTTSLEWREAVRRSDEYKEKSSHSLVKVSPGPKRQRELSNFSNPSYAAEPQRLRRRHKTRLSAEMTLARRTDDMLAKRLHEKRDENERRWARGTLLNVLTSQLRSKASTSKDGLLQNWRTWLCTNPDSEQTAIWLEQKFDVPTSGAWVSDLVFSMFCDEAAAGDGHPGFILFECTALDGVADEIEKKYRVLDDCTRLREVLQLMPEDHHYAPSILLLSWDHRESSDTPSELVEMIRANQEQGKVLDCQVFSLSIKDYDIDNQFNRAVDEINLDFDGLLVEKLLLSDIFARFAEVWLENLMVWIEACNMGEECDWRLLSHVLKAFFSSLSHISKEVASLWGYKGSSWSMPPPLNTEGIQDADTTRTAFRLWLQSPELSSIPLARHLSTFDFSDYAESRSYLTQICSIFFQYLQDTLNDDGKRRQRVPKTKLASSKTAFDQLVQDMEKQLRGTLKTLPRRHKRRVSASGNGDISMASVTSIVTSPSPPPNTLQYAAAPASDVSLYSAPPSPTPSHALSNADASNASLVTVSALRALAQSVLKTYGKK